MILNPLIAACILVIGYLFGLYLQMGRGYSYQSHPLTFSVLYALIVGLIVYSVEPEFLIPWVNSIGVIAIFVASAAFVYISSKTKQRLKSFRLPKRLPAPAHHLIRQDFRFALVKLGDLAAQHACFSVVILYLLDNTDYSKLTIGFMLAVFLAVFHSPAPKYFGHFVGYSFLLIPTVVVFIAPYLVLEYSFGLHVLFIVHILYYIFLPYLYQSYATFMKFK